VDRGAKIFWGLVVVLAGASTFFGVGAVREHQSLAHATVELQTGDVVHLARSVDGDTIVVKSEQGSEVEVRILGIKAFEPQPERDPTSRFGRDATAAIEELSQKEGLRVMIHTTPKDSHGRTLATLFAGNADLGLELVKRGLVMVYTPYPFPAMSVYLQAQSEARSARRGLWGDQAASDRADAFAHEWGNRSP
jgi:micrococcal nuclease